MSNFKITKDIDSENTVLNSFIPTGTLIMKAMLPSKLSEYDTDEECLAAGFVPCDGRLLESYKFGKLHSVIGNIYGGSPFIDGVTDRVSTKKIATSYTTSSNLLLQRFVTINVDNSDFRIVAGSNVILPGYYEGNGIQVSGATETSISFTDSLLLFYPPSMPYVFYTSAFNVPNLRNNKRYLRGLPEATKESPSITSGTNTLVHNHTYSILGPNSIASATGNNHTHGISHASAGLNTSHTHYVEGGYNGNTGQQAPNYTQAKVDGTGSTSASNHTHGVAVNFAGNSAGTTYNRDHAHNGSGTSSNNAASNTHNHSVDAYTIDTTNDLFTLSGPSDTAVLPSINVLYFIKI